MVQVIDTGGTIAGRIGKGFGQGLAEQVPKEIERYRLSSGLKKLGEQDFSGKNPLQILGEISNIPGITPEIANVALQQVQKQQFKNRPRQAQNLMQPSAMNARIPSTAPTTMPKQGIQQIKESPANMPKPESGFASPSQITEYKASLLQKPNQEQIDDLAEQYLDQNLTQDFREARQLAANELNQNIIAQKEKNVALRTDLDNRLKLSLQGGGLGDFKDVVGDIQKKLVDQGEYMSNQLGLTPEEASQRIDDIALNLGKAANSLKDTGHWTRYFKSSKTKAQELKSQKEEFEKYGFGEEFDDMAAGALGISSLQAANVLDPLKNEVIVNEISKLKDYRKHGNYNENVKEKQLDQIIKNIKPSDNLFSIEYELRNKGYDPNQFKRRVQDLEANKEIALTPQQKRQQRRPIRSDFLGDLLFQAF